MMLLLHIIVTRSEPDDVRSLLGVTRAAAGARQTLEKRSWGREAWAPVSGKWSYVPAVFSKDLECLAASSRRFCSGKLRQGLARECISVGGLSIARWESDQTLVS